MKNLFILLALLFSLIQIQAQPVPQNNFDTVWTRWTHDVKYVRFSPDGNLIASNNRGQVVVYDTETGNTIYVYSSVLETRFTPDNKYLVGYFASELVVIEVETWTKKTDIVRTPFGITCYDISKDGKRIIAGYEGKYGYGVWDIETGQIIQDVTLPIEDSVNSRGAYIGDIKYGKDDLTILYETNRGIKGTPPPPDKQYTIEADAVTGEIKHRVEFAAFFVYSNDKTKIAYRIWEDNSFAIHIIDAETWQSVINIPGIPQDVRDMTFSPDDNYLVVAYGLLDKNIKVYNLSGGSITYKYQTQPPDPIDAIDISKNNQYLIAGNGTQLILFFNHYTLVNQIDTSNFSFIYPNPTTGIIKIEFNLTKGERVFLQLYDNSGKNINSINFGLLESGNNSYEFNTKNLASGIYFLILQSPSFLQTYKLVKE